MVSISRLRKDELYKHAVEAGYDLPADEVQREDLIEYLRENSDLVDPTKVNRSPKPNANLPTITSEGKKVEVDYDVEVDSFAALSEFIESVKTRTAELYDQEIPADDGQFWEIASLVINACTQPDELTFETITTYRKSALTMRFFGNTLRSSIAVLRDHPRQLGSAVQCAVVDTVAKYAGPENADRRRALLEEIQQIKQGSEERNGSGESDEVPGDDPEDEDDEGGAQPEDEHGNGD